MTYPFSRFLQDYFKTVRLIKFNWASTQLNFNSNSELGTTQLKLVILIFLTTTHLSYPGHHHLTSHCTVESSQLLQQFLITIQATGHAVLWLVDTDHCCVGYLDSHWFRCWLHQSCNVHCVPKNREMGHFWAHHPSNTTPRVNPHSHLHLVVPHMTHLKLIILKNLFRHKQQCCSWSPLDFEGSAALLVVSKCPALLGWYFLFHFTRNPSTSFISLKAILEISFTCCFPLG